MLRVIALSALLALGPTACKPTLPADPGGKADGDGSLEQDQCPLFERDPMKEPDLMAWDATQRQKVHEKRMKGVVAVRMEKTGECYVTARVVDCVGRVGGAGDSGPYSYNWYYASETVVVDSQRDAYAKLPLGAASLGGALRAGNSLRIDYVIAGTYVLPDELEPQTWAGIGRECSEATHYVKRVVVGGFARATGKRDEVRADVGVFGAGIGASQQRTQLRWRKEGSPTACAEAERSRKKNAGCNMPLRLELVPIPDSPAVADAPERELPETPAPPRVKADAKVSTARSGPSAPVASSRTEPATRSRETSGTCKRWDVADCRAKCDRGDAASCRELGLSYKWARGVGEDLDEAGRLFSRACDAGDMSGCVEYGLLCEFSLYSGHDEARALRLYGKACDNGHMPGCYRLGAAYYFGEAFGYAVQRDYRQAVRLYQQACDGGDFDGCWGLGGCLKDGHGIAKDLDRAMQLFRKACDNGNDSACRELE